MKPNSFLKYSLLFFVQLTFCISIHAQSIIDEDFLEVLSTNAKAHTDNHPAFSISAAPDKWKNESAVIIGYKRSITFDKQSTSGLFSGNKAFVYLFEAVHFKVKLQDRNAVQTFMEVYFRFGEREDGFAAKIIKHSGEAVDVDLSDAVQIESKSEAPEFYQSFFDKNSASETRYYKVAVPNLEAGDVLEYTAYTKSKLNVKGTGYVEFDPQYELCSKRYPVMFNEISIDTDDKTFFKSLSLNGAPEFKKENSEASGFFRYVFTDKDRGTVKDVNFISPYLANPLVKFQVIYANSSKVQNVSLIGDKGELKQGFSKDELAKVAWANYSFSRNYPINSSGTSADAFVNYSFAQMKKDGWADLPEDRYVENIYYRIRNQGLFRNNYLPDAVFAYMFRAFMDKRNIQTSLIITCSNKMGSMKDILFDEEIRYVVKLRDKYIFNCTDHSNPDELVESLLGNEAYVIGEPNRKTGDQEITPITLPDSKVADNSSQFDSNASYDPATGTMIVARTCTYTGINKSREVDDRVKFTTYMLDDFKIFNGPSLAENLTGRALDEYYTSVQALKEEYKTAKPEQVENSLKNEYNSSVKYKNFRIVSDGRSLKKKNLQIIEDFELGNMTKHAGKKLLLNLTGLMGDQLHITGEERTRTKDIYMGYPRKFTWNIHLTVPAGYAVKGLKELNKNIENETGKFSCEAKEENGVVHITVIKQYNQRNMPKEKWNELLAFVDAAHDQIFKYVLLMPK
ncbi:MAG: DUF3857 domain-containing protein [Chitinophagaceae bacterium]|nr:DUF3857 domain-containing protein [Chitinophagaceae bacterium]